MANILKETVRGIDCVRIEDELLSGREIFLTEEVNACLLYTSPSPRD